MKNSQNSIGFSRKRKFFTVLPLLALPFLTLLFWSLGGGKSTDALASGKQQKGFNLDLPDAKNQDKAMDKMSYYDQATSDSLKRSEQLKNDPNYVPPIGVDSSSPVDSELVPNLNNVSSPNLGTVSKGNYNDPNEAKVYAKLAQLNATINQPAIQDRQIANIKETGAEGKSADIDRLEQMMRAMNQKGDEDPEMKQLNGMLERILDVQHPERVQEKLQQASSERMGQVFPVSTGKRPTPVSSLDKDEQNLVSGTTDLFNTTNGFYSLEQIPLANDSQNAIQAVVHETQTIVNGSTVKLRLTNDIYISGTMIPRDNFLFGIAALNGERLTIKINSIRYRNSLFPVELLVYDMDGLDGIYIPGAISRDVSKESADRGLQNLGFSSLDPSVGMQAASVGVEAAKTLFSKKVKLIRVTVKAGYQVLLRDEKQKLQN